jgi:hypothetical protein
LICWAAFSCCVGCVPGLMSTLGAGTGASGTEVVGGPAGGVGVVGAGALGAGADCAWAAICAPLPARHNAKSAVSKAEARKDLNVITLVLVARMTPSVDLPSFPTGGGGHRTRYILRSFPTEVCARPKFRLNSANSVASGHAKGRACPRKGASTLGAIVFFNGRGRRGRS